jgi:hypothetical protein
LGYVLAVACSHQVRTGLGVQRADRLAADLPDTAWQRVSAGAGAKGHRYCDWSWTSLPAHPDDHRIRRDGRRATAARPARAQAAARAARSGPP